MESIWKPVAANEGFEVVRRFLGSAPTSCSQSTKGLETPRIRLGAIQPAENIAEFYDALTALHSSLAYLYSNPSAERFWYDTRPTLRKTVEERATQIPTSDVDYEIENRLRKWKKQSRFPVSISVHPLH